MRVVDLSFFVDARAFAQQLIIRVFDVVCGKTRFAIEPEIADHAVTGRMCASCQCHVADDSFCICMCVMCIAIHDSVFPKVANAAVAESVVIPRRQVTAQLIYRDLKDQFGLASRCLRS